MRQGKAAAAGAAAPIAVGAATLDWLLSERNPPVRYLTLTRLLGRGEGSAEVEGARARLGDYGPTRRILARRAEFWREGGDFYHKYRGGYWQLIFLGELLAPRDSPGLAEGVERVLARARPEGNGPWKGKWWGIHCLNGNLLRAMVALGFGDDPRVRAGLEHLAGEILAARGVPCFIIDWSVLPTCHMSLPKVLLALTALPEGERSAAQRRAAQVCVERLLEHQVSRYVSPRAREWYRVLPTLDVPRSPHPDPEPRRLVAAARERWLADSGGRGQRVEKAGWRRFGFPLHYNSDTLEALRALVQAGAPPDAAGARAAVDHVLARRRRDGRWTLDRSFNGRMVADVGKRGRASRWITFYALWVLRHYRGLVPA